MKKSLKDHLANTLVDEFYDKVGDPDNELASEIEIEIEDREVVRDCLRRADHNEIESSIESAQALIDKLDLSECNGEVSWELEFRIQHARAVLANSFLALYGGFGDRPVVEA